MPHAILILDCDNDPDSSLRTFPRRPAPSPLIPNPRSGHFLGARRPRPSFRILIQDIFSAPSALAPHSESSFRTLVRDIVPALGALAPHFESSFRTFSCQSAPSVAILNHDRAFAVRVSGCAFAGSRSRSGFRVQGSGFHNTDPGSGCTFNGPQPHAPHCVVASELRLAVRISWRPFTTPATGPECGP